MLCTDCKKPLKPVVALDIDGTLGGWHNHFLDFAEGYFDRSFDRRYRGDGDLSDHMRLTKDEYRQCKLAYRQGGLKRTMPCHSGAANLVSSLHILGVEVWITTTRPYLRMDNIDPDTREWLRRNKIEYDGLLYDEDKYAVLAETVGGDRVCAVLDDLPECYDRAAELELHPILLARMHNTLQHRPVLAANLGEAKKIIIRRVADWKEHHGQHR